MYCLNQFEFIISIFARLRKLKGDKQIIQTSINRVYLILQILNLLYYKMEKIVNDRTKQSVAKFKDDLRNKILELGLSELPGIADFVGYLYDYDIPAITKDDLVQKKRTQNTVPPGNRCIAKRQNGEQCSRSRRNDCEFCGTHFKGTPHGLITEASADNSHEVVKLGVFAENISGIVYYLDKFGNVYNTREILEGTTNPSVIAKWVKIGDKYTIPEFGI